MAGYGEAEIGELLDQTRRVLRGMRDASAEPGVAAEREVVGEALDGQIRATLVDGQLQSLTMEPRLMRLASEELCEHIVAAVNAALGTARATAPSAAGIDPEALAGQLERVQEQSLRQMRDFGSAMNDALARMRQARG